MCVPVHSENKSETKVCSISQYTSTVWDSVRNESVLCVPVQREIQSGTKVCFVYQCSVRFSQKRKCTLCTSTAWDSVRNESVFCVPVQR